MGSWRVRIREIESVLAVSHTLFGRRIELGVDRISGRSFRAEGPGQSRLRILHVAVPWQFIKKCLTDNAKAVCKMTGQMRGRLSTFDQISRHVEISLNVNSSQTSHRGVTNITALITPSRRYTHYPPPLPFHKKTVPHFPKNSALTPHTQTPPPSPSSSAPHQQKPPSVSYPPHAAGGSEIGL